MTYIRQDSFGSIFMHVPNNVVFHSANAQFDENLFLKCPNNKGRQLERPKNPPESYPEPQNNYSNGPKFDDNDAPDDSKYKSTCQYEPSHKRPSNTNNGSAPFSFSGSGSSSPPQPVWNPMHSQQQAPPE
jgi:hypothetical protein